MFNLSQLTAYFIFIVCFWVVSTHLQANETTVLDNDSCLSCHADMTHKDIAALLDAECTQCHATPDITGEKNRVSAHLDALEETNLPLHSDKTLLLPGMSYPQYYKGTRLHNAPNNMIFIPSGKFTMGTNHRLPDEGPEHIASTADYWFDLYEVTNLQYKAFIDTTNRKSPNHFENRTYPPGKADHPVTYVTWHDANAYCQWTGKRLPTNTEWEKAARSTDARIYPWGSTFKINYANTPQRWKDLKKDGDTTPVGSFSEGISHHGVYDMSGNVWEWTNSDYTPYPGNTRINENYNQDYKTLKGGSWWDCSFYKCGISAPVFNRSFFLMSTKNKTFGFRCANDQKTATIENTRH